ncbi:SCO-spondin-like isoform X2 [Acanthaster planci]|uniref:SCO-spondin-like isoform X2 n=1 Tax=Acanthaster planci TaxID=133434 RepID=A0A8B7XJD6_ACAPL|nr:SCO-spondin-like isoform X2 [Acanthaster planci]
METRNGLSLILLIFAAMVDEAYQDCAAGAFDETFSRFKVTDVLSSTGNERTVTFGCRFGYHYEDEDPTQPNFLLSQETLHCANGEWDGFPRKCSASYYTLLEALDHLDYRNESAWEGEKLEIDFFIKSPSFITEGPFVYKANGDEVPNAEMSGFLRQDRGVYSRYVRWTAYLTKEDTGYYYYHDKEVAYYDRQLRQIVSSPRYEYFYIEVSGPQDGEWGEWTPWGDCTSTCGVSTRYRERACDNPPPLNGGADCPGPANMTEACPVDLCPVHGGWSGWGAWSECSVTCGGGSITRSRACDDPAPSWGGDDCPGEAEETEVCSPDPCPVDGNWAPWSTWSACSRTCGGGTTGRVRTCTDPAPEHGGSDCAGEDAEFTDCGDAACRTDGNWAQWTEWSPCSKTCGFGIKTRERTCSDPPPTNGGDDCPGVGIPDNYFQQEDCMDVYDCPVHGNWTEWSAWGNCTLACGGGEIVRSRNCTNPVPAFGGRSCEGNATEVIPDCNPEPCGVDGAWSGWSNWTSCTKTCGGGTMFRNRTCTEPPPTHGGLDCEGTSGDAMACHTERCLDGAWTQWSPWSVCSRSCRGGVQARSRSCTDPRPGPGGSDCPDSSDPRSYSQWQRCNEQPCPIHGLWSSWSSWSACPVTCGGSYRVSVRNCSQPEPQWGGRQCPGNAVKTWRCKTMACPLFGAPEGVVLIPSDTNVTVVWSLPLEYEWPLLYYNVHYRKRLTGNESLSTVLHSKSGVHPYRIYNLTSFRTLPTKDNITFSMTVRGLSAFTDYELCLTATYGHHAAMSGHSQVLVVRTLKHGSLPAIKRK